MIRSVRACACSSAVPRVARGVASRRAASGFAYACWWPVWPLTLSLLGKSRRSLKWHQTSFEPVQCRWPAGDRRSQVTRIVKPEPVARCWPGRNSGLASPRASRHDRASTVVYQLPRLPFRTVRANLSADPVSFILTPTVNGGNRPARRGIQRNGPGELVSRG